MLNFFYFFRNIFLQYFKLFVISFLIGLSNFNNTSFGLICFIKAHCYDFKIPYIHFIFELNL